MVRDVHEKVENMTDERRLRKITTPYQRVAWVLTVLTIGIALLAVRDRDMSDFAAPGSGLWIAIALVALCVSLVVLRVLRHGGVRG